MAVLKIYNGASWDTARAKLRYVGTWEPKMLFYDGSSWVPLFPVVEPDIGGVINDTDLPTVVAGVAFNNTGFEKASTASGSYTVDRGEWLNYGSSSDYWVERTINSGSLNYSDPGAGRLNLGTTRQFAVSDTTYAGGAVTCSVTFDFYDAATGGNLLASVTYTLSANKSV